MSNWSDAYALVLKKLSLDSTTTGSAALTDAKLALIEAMNFHKKIPFWFNKKKYTIGTVNEMFRYSLPIDFMGLVSDPMYNSESTVSAVRSRLVPRPLAWAEEHKWRGSPHEMTINTGPPKCYAIDESSNEILFVPVPSQTGESVEFQYQSDGEIPVSKLVSGVWKFYVPGTDTEISDSFKNGFLDKAQYMIVYKACHIMLLGDYEDGGEGRKSQNMERLWAAEQNKMIGENNRRAGAKGIRPRLR